MRGKEEILLQVDYYKDRLALAIEEKNKKNSACPQDLDLLIFSLVDKLEALLWVLDIDLPNGNAIDKYLGLYH